MQKGSVKSKMIWILSCITIFTVAVIIFFQIPYSPVRNEFQREAQRNLEQTAVYMQQGVFTEKDIEHLPEPVRNHFISAGLLGQPKMNSVKVFMPSVPLYQSKDSSPLILDYTLCLFVHPARLAYMTTSMFGLPFEAYDSTQEGVGFMRGVIGKVFTMFNETGPEMDRGQLLTWLGEAPLMPSIFLSEYITWEPIDAAHVRAALTYKGITGSGVFTFNADGFIQSFYTEDRARTGTDGSVDFHGWSAVMGGWIKDESGIYTPSSAKAVWHLPDGDLVYFEANNFRVVANTF